MTPTQKKLGLVALIAFLIWWFFFKPQDAVSAAAQTGYVPPNDPTRMATDPTLNNRPPNCSSSGPGYGSPNAPQARFTGYIRQQAGV